jgi:hypothetical protein
MSRSWKDHGSALSVQYIHWYVFECMNRRQLKLDDVIRVLFNNVECTK